MKVTKPRVSIKRVYVGTRVSRDGREKVDWEIVMYFFYCKFVYKLSYHINIIYYSNTILIMKVFI